MEIAEELNKPEWIAESKLFLAGIQAKTGMFSEAIEILNSITKNLLTPELKVNYYKAYWETYVYWLEYQDGNNIATLSANRINYQDSLLRNLSPNSYEYVTNYATYYIENNELVQVEELLSGYFNQVIPETREYSIYTSLMAYLYEKNRMLKSRKNIWLYLLYRILKRLLKKIFLCVLFHYLCLKREIYDVLIII